MKAEPSLALVGSENFSLKGIYHESIEYLRRESVVFTSFVLFVLDVSKLTDSEKINIRDFSDGTLYIFF